MPFGPNLIGTQTTSVKPKIVEWGSFSLAPALLNSAIASMTGPTSASVTEGNLAWAAFKFVDPADGTTIKELMDTATLNVNLTGASAADYVNGGQLYVYALDVNGNVISAGNYTQPTSTTPKTSGSITFADSISNPVGAGTGVHGLLLVTPVKVDSVIETGDRVLFQVTNNDSTKFTDSAYVEKYVDIVDFYTASSRLQIVVSGEVGIGNTNTSIYGVPAALLDASGPTGGGTVLNSPTLLFGGTATYAFPGFNTSAGPAWTPSSAVQEGQWAVGKFSLVDASTFNAPGAGLDNATTYLKVGYSGASANDYSPNSFKVYATNSAGNLLSSALTVTNGKVLLPQGTSDIYLTVRTAQDALVESGEEVIFQVGKVDVNSFTASDYVEKKVAINDFVHQWVVTNPTPALGLTSTAQDEVTVTGSASKVWDAVNNTNGFVTLNNFGTGDYLKVDIALTTSPNLALANFANLNMKEAKLVEGLRLLDGIDCMPGGVYVMGATENNSTTLNTYILIDSNNDGFLSTNGGADVFVKLAGVAPSAIESTDFLLV